MNRLYNVRYFVAEAYLTNGSGESLAESESGGAGLRSDVASAKYRKNFIVDGARGTWKGRRSKLSGSERVWKGYSRHEVHK